MTPNKLYKADAVTGETVVRLGCIGEHGTVRPPSDRPELWAAVLGVTFFERAAIGAPVAGSPEERSCW
jgi:hypothetical protein